MWLRLPAHTTSELSLRPLSDAQVEAVLGGLGAALVKAHEETADESPGQLIHLQVGSKLARH